ncbi:Hansenula MRAKII killer toxin-resistant protein 1 [Paractinoplanes lichenicola]|uniref:Hansenula MRAKII killer toxin-resistant protein 1 n=1 Tax=Paractinoplanes lichenicola TaxID=2802976 RepID=A0ABS1W225_9ACTN|nr:Hansenula MRAKII killer toxin-resistant protein 1 [Actinoplanes lichenicola]MBL7260783.1 Hansenula MRAKII killer toxin-resistant protein 1 [Actinoplanes lichenicola]
MADKGWTARVATAAGAAAGTGAAQLGLGYGLGVVVWPVTPTPDDSAWLGSLGWATWITASATVFGAVLGSRSGGGPGPRTTAAWRFALAACAALGALVTVALIALPARSAVRFDSYSPQVIAGGYAMAGLVLGLVIAFWAVSSPPVAANLMATGVWLWALAIAAIVVELTVNRDSATYLTSWQFAEVANSGLYGTIYWPSALLTLSAAFLVGALTAVPAARRGDVGIGAATSGLAGPLLVAFAFLALAPRLTGALGPIESAYLIAPYAVLAGLAGSVLAVAGTRTVQQQRSDRAGAVVTGTARVPEPPALEPPPATPAPKRSSDAPTAKIPKPPARAAEADPPKKQRSGLFGRRKAPAQPAQHEPQPVAPAARTAPAPRPTPTPTTPSDLDTAVRAKADKKDNGQPAPVDSEIAAAARPAPRPRPKKAAAAEPKPTRSTVTPPPTAPAVAQINPKAANTPPKAPPPANPKPAD